TRRSRVAAVHLCGWGGQRRPNLLANRRPPWRTKVSGSRVSLCFYVYIPAAPAEGRRAMDWPHGGGNHLPVTYFSGFGGSGLLNLWLIGSRRGAGASRLRLFSIHDTGVCCVRG